MGIARAIRILLTTLCVSFALLGTGLASEESWTAFRELPAKSPGHLGADLATDSRVSVEAAFEADGREGGEDMARAVPIMSLPFADTGNTCGHLDDFAEMCPYGNWAPDLWYALEVTENVFLTVDLCGSLYDTATFVVDANYGLLACNDDYYFDEICGYYVSKIDRAFIAGGQTVYILMDGYTNACGEYLVEIFTEPIVPCVLECPGGAEFEGEPPLQDNYADAFNGGCNSPEYGNPFQDLHGMGGNTLTFCGKAGWYEIGGDGFRDTDWFTAILVADGTGLLEIELDAELESYLFELGPHDCDYTVVMQSVLAGPCSPATMTIVGTPGDLVWIWVGADGFVPPYGFEGHEYDYVMTITGLEDGIISSEARTWSEVKSVYR